MKNSKLTALLMGIALAGANFACMPSRVCHLKSRQTLIKSGFDGYNFIIFLYSYIQKILTDFLIAFSSDIENNFGSRLIPKAERTFFNSLTFE